MQQACGERIARTGGIHHLRRLEGELMASLIGNAPAHGSRSIGDHHIRPLGQSGAHRSGVIGGETPHRLLPGQLDQILLDLE